MGYFAGLQKIQPPAVQSTVTGNQVESMYSLKGEQIHKLFSNKKTILELRLEADGRSRVQHGSEFRDPKVLTSCWIEIVIHPFSLPPMLGFRDGGKDAALITEKIALSCAGSHAKPARDKLENIPSRVYV